MFSRRCFVPALSLIVMTQSIAAWGADADADSDSWLTRLTAELAGGYDSNPTQGSRQSSNRAHGDADSFGKASAGAKVSAPVIPLVCSGRIEDREYAHQAQETEDHVLIQSAAELPLHLRQTTLAPHIFIDDEWYGDAYYSTTTHGAFRWTQEWSPEWSTDLIPFVEHTSYRPPNRGQDGSASGVDASASWWPKESLYVRSITIDVGASRYRARAYANSYRQSQIGIDQAYRLPWMWSLDLDLTWLPTRYNTPVAGKQENRQDRIFEGEIDARRSLGSGLNVKLSCLVTNDRSNRPAQQYHEAVVSAGLVWELN